MPALTILIVCATDDAQCWVMCDSRMTLLSVFGIDHQSGCRQVRLRVAVRSLCFPFSEAVRLPVCVNDPQAPPA